MRRFKTLTSPRNSSGGLSWSNKKQVKRVSKGVKRFKYGRK